MINDQIISINFVGTFAYVDIKKSSDLDIVIICKKLSLELFNEISKNISEIKINKYSNYKKKVIINSTFGPLKLGNRSDLIIHLMIYDIEGHKKHVIKSPFTCYDWELTKPHYGKSLKSIFPVRKLFFTDFIKSKRSIKSFKKQLENSKIDYQYYFFHKKTYEIKKKTKKLDNLNYAKFCFHILQNVSKNYIKFKKDKNFYVSEKNILTFFKSLGKEGAQISFFFKELKRIKITGKCNLKKQFLKENTFLFIKNFEKKTKYDYSKFRKIIFKRHFKPKVEKKIFLGSNSNPDIYKKKLKQKDFVSFSSPMKRCINTAKIMFKKRPIISKYLIEINYGKLDGEKVEVLNKKFPNLKKLWRKGVDAKFPNGENTFQVLERVEKFIYKLKNMKKLSSKTYVITHNVFLRCLLGKYLNYLLKDFFRIKINYGQEFEVLLNKDKIYLNLDRNKYFNQNDFGSLVKN